MSNDQAKLQIEERAQKALTLQKQVEEQVSLLKQAQQEIDETWKDVESQMIEHDVKSIKGDWGSLTIAERLSWNVDLEELPRKFIKKVADTKKISDTYRLEGKAPKGAEPKYTKYLHKRIK